MKKIISIFILLITIFLFSGCSEETIKVCFETNGGNEITAIELKNNKLNDFSLPNNPVKDGYTFKGWYLDSDFKEEFKSLDDMNKDVTLYAKWEEIKEYTITLIDGDNCQYLKIKEGEKLAEPKVTESKEYEFFGWYNDEIKFDFDSIITSDLTLNAKWGTILTPFNENKTIVDKDYITKYSEGNVLKINKLIKIIYSSDINSSNVKKIYFEGTEEDFRNIEIISAFNDDIQIYINNEPINFSIVSSESIAEENVNIKIIIYLNNDYQNENTYVLPKNSKVTYDYFDEIIHNAPVFHSFNDLGNTTFEFYEDEQKNKKIDFSFFNNLTDDATIYVFFEEEADFLQNMQGILKSYNGDECIINDCEITILGKTYSLEANSWGKNVITYQYYDEFIFLTLGVYFVNQKNCLSIMIFDNKNEEIQFNYFFLE